MSTRDSEKLKRLQLVAIPPAAAHPKSSVQEGFRALAHRSAELMASHVAFAAAGSLILVWLLSGPFFHFSDTWQLIVNTGTTVITFLMVFLIQNSQNRDTRAIQLKLDELLRAVKEARTELVSLEDLSDEELDKLRKEFARLAEADRRSTPPVDS